MRISLFSIVIFGTIASAAPGRGPLSQLPAWFESAEDGKTFISRNSEAVLRAGPTGLSWARGGSTVRLKLAGSAARWEWMPAGHPLGTANYLIGRDRGQWRTGVARHAELVAKDVLPGVDLHLYACAEGLEYDFVLAPGADPGLIRVSFEGAAAALDSRGDLVVTAPGLSMKQRAPVAYQARNGSTTGVEASWRLTGDGAGFEIGSYDPAEPLVIDPVITYSGYFGGTLIDRISAVTRDGQGGFWLTGSIRSSIPAVEGTDPLQAEKKEESDAFVARIVQDGSTWRLDYMSYIGGSGDEAGEAIAFKDGFLYVAGQTNSSNWPLAGEAFQPTLKSVFDAFILKLDTRSSGSESLFYSSYFGGELDETVTSIAVDSQDRIAVAGHTTSTALERVVPGTDLQPSNRGGVDGFYFFCQTNSSASENLISGSFFGGNSTDIISAIAFDPAGNLLMVGSTFSSDIPLFGAGYQSEQQGGGDIMVVKVNPRLRGFDALLLGTYVGDGGLDVATSMQLDSDGTMWVAGYTISNNLPVTAAAHQRSRAGGADAFLAGFNPSAGGSDFLRYMSYFGGSQDDVAYGIAISAGGEKTLAGYTYSRDLPLKDNPTPPATGLRQSDLFVTRINTNQTGSAALTYSVLFGGPGQDVAFGLSQTAGGLPFVAGTSSSPGLQSEGTPAKPNGPGYTTGLFLQLGPARP